MIHKEDIDKELNESQAIIKQQEEKIKETKKYTETINTCKEILEEIQKERDLLFDNQKVLNDNINACGTLFKTMNSKIEEYTNNNTATMNDFKTSLNNTNQDIKRAIHNDITDNIQAEMIQIKQNTNDFVKNIDTYKTSLNETINKLSTELENNIKQYKEKMDKETSKIILSNKALFFFFIIFSLITTLYCINWQFGCIPFMQEIETPQIVKYIIIFLSGGLVFFVISKLIKGLLDK